MAATSFDTTLSSLGIKRATTSTTILSADSKQAKGTLDQADFLKLMTAQMKNQDPFNPTDNTQMVAQMAQFSSLAGISEMSTTLKAMADKIGATSSTEAMSYIGKTVLTEGNVAYPRTTGGIAGAVELAGAASDVKVTITNANGEIVKSISLGKQIAGTTTYDWDGKTANGEDAGSGPFTVSVTAQNNGKSVGATGLVWAPVESVSTSSGSAVLSLSGLGRVPVTAVRSIG